MLDKQTLRSVVEKLRVPVDQLVYDPGFAEVATGHVGTRGKLGELYLSYFQFKHFEGTIRVRPPKGNYKYRWLNPAHDGLPPNSEGEFEATGELVPLLRPEFESDIVLIVERVPEVK
jgi:hypothetical protein